MPFKQLEFVKPGDPVEARSWNDIVGQLRALSAIGGTTDNLFVGSGAFARRAAAPVFRQFKLQGDLRRESTATAAFAEWDSATSEFESIAGPSATIRGDLSTGYWFQNDIVMAIFLSGEWFAVGSGSTFLTGEIVQVLVDGGSALMDVFSANKMSSGVQVTIHEKLGLESGLSKHTNVAVNWDEYDQQWVLSAAQCGKAETSI